MRLVACLALVNIVACTTWRPVDVTPAVYLHTNDPDQVRLTLNDSSRVNLRAPVLHGDTIVGLTGAGSPHGTAHPRAVPLSNVRSIAVPQFSATKSAGLSILILTAIAIPRCVGGQSMFC